jgi:hypothetical protein
MTCFLCLEKGGFKPCVTCKVQSHGKCWAEYKKNGGINCPQCRTEIPNRLTRNSFKNELLNNLQNMITECQYSIGRENKLAVIDKIFIVLIDNTWFIKKHVNLSKIVKVKLIEFHFNDNWYKADNYHYKFFGTYLTCNQNIRKYK